MQNKLQEQLEEERKACSDFMEHSQSERRLMETMLNTLANEYQETTDKLEKKSQELDAVLKKEAEEVEEAFGLATWSIQFFSY